MRISTIALRNLSRNRKRSVLSLTAIAVAAMSISMVFGVIEGMQQNLKSNSFTYMSGQVRVRHKDYDTFEQLNPSHLTVPEGMSLARLFSEHPDIAAVSPRVRFPGAVFLGEQRHPVAGMGVDFTLEQNFMDFEQILGAGSIPQTGSNEVLIGYKMAEKFNLGIGDSFTVLATTATRGNNAFTLRISGLAVFPLEGMNSSTMVMSLGRAQQLLWMQDHVSEILLIFNPAVPEEKTTAIANSIINHSGIKDIQAKSWLDIGSFVSMMKWAETVYYFIALFFFILGSTVIVNTTMMTVYERLREIGTLGAMGMNDKTLVRLFFTEAFFLGLAGSFIGILLGIAIVIPLSHFGIDYGEALEGMDIGISSIIYPQINMRSNIIIFFYSLAVASLTSLIPSRKAAKIQPVEALRSV